MRHRAAKTFILGSAAAALVLQAQPAESLDNCPETSPTKSYDENELDNATDPDQTDDVGLRDGVVYDDSGGFGLLRLKRQGGYFTFTRLPISDPTVFAAAGDFNQDGWDDFVGGGESNKFLRIYRNKSELNLPVDWADPEAVLEPNFEPCYEPRPWQVEDTNRWHPIAAGDFNGDGWDDVFYATARPFLVPYEALIWLNNGANDALGDPTFGAEYDAFSGGTAPADMGPQAWGGPITVIDVNGDRKLDLVIGSGAATDGVAGTSTVKVFHNMCNLVTPLPDPAPVPPAPLPCADNPTFQFAGNLIEDLFLGDLGDSYNRGEFAVMTYQDFDQDADMDLVVAAPACCTDEALRLRFFPGLEGGVLSPNPDDVQSITFVGAATVTLAGDFSLDGKLDLVVGTDNWNYPIAGYSDNEIGGQTFYYENDGTSTPFSAGVTQQLSWHDPSHAEGTLFDFDLGFVFDYDNDPDSTPDLMMADGNHSETFFIFANRVVSQYVPCGEVATGILDLTEMGLQDLEMVITAARLTPNHAYNGGEITYYMSNETPADWVEATDCADGTGDYCASFNKPVGREIQWKAVMCSNPGDPIPNSTSPEIYDIDIRFDYTQASVHYRTGVVVHDGVAYAGGFRQPGQRGHFYAINAALDAALGIYWDAADRIDADMLDSERKIFTTNLAGDTLIPFNTSERENEELQAVLGTNGDPDATEAVINWVRSGRFGVGNDGIPLSKLGAIETSTPAVMGRPALPFYYSYLAGAEAAKAEQFHSDLSGRPILALFGSKDGLIHAVYTNPQQMNPEGDPWVGKEVWAIIPPTVITHMQADFTETQTLGELTIRHYPDGSPAVTDIEIDGAYRTVALVGGGNGGESVFAMDVTNTVDPGLNYAMIDTASGGLRPLWTFTPGGSLSGNGHSKPAIFRTKIDGAARFLAIVGSGIDPDFDDRGLIVSAVDIPTGEEVWRFKARCPLTSNIVGFETDDELEPYFPELDGFIDRIVFADKCGYMYKLDPAKDQSDETSIWNNNVNLGNIAVEESPGIPYLNDAGEQIWALFSTAQDGTGSPLGERPIVGTIGAASDSTTRMVLYFGTGGLEAYPPNLENAFYGIYADTGEWRSRRKGLCIDPGPRCEKFYGGVVVTSEQVIVVRTMDAPVATAECDTGSTTVDGYKINETGEEEEDRIFQEDFNVDFGSAVVASLYGHGGAVYAATLAGDIVRVGEPRSREAGGDTTGGHMDQMGQSEQDAGGAGTDLENAKMTIMGWRQVL